MYVNKCIKCGREFETKNPKRVICPDCLYPDKKMMVSPSSTNDSEANSTPASSYSSEPLNGIVQVEQMNLLVFIAPVVALNLDITDLKDLITTNKVVIADKAGIIDLIITTEILKVVIIDLIIIIIDKVAVITDLKDLTIIKEVSKTDVLKIIEITLINVLFRKKLLNSYL